MAYLENRKMRTSLPIKPCGDSSMAIKSEITR